MCSVSLQFTCARSFVSLQMQVATLTCVLFHCWTLLRNNNMETNLQVFTSCYCSRQGCHMGEFVGRFRKSVEFWKRLVANIWGLDIWWCLVIFWKHLAPMFLVWQNVAYDLYICPYLLPYLYVDLLILSLRMVWKFMTSNESVKVLKVEAWYWTIRIKYSMFLKCGNWLCRNSCKMLKISTLSGKIQSRR